VPGIGASVEVGCARVPATRPEVLPWALLASDESSLARRSSDGMLDEDRRRWWNPVTTGEAAGSLLFGGSTVLSFPVSLPFSFVFSLLSALWRLVCWFVLLRLQVDKFLVDKKCDAERSMDGGRKSRREGTRGASQLEKSFPFRSSRGKKKS